MYDHNWARSVVAKTMLCSRAQQYDKAFEDWYPCLKKHSPGTLAGLLTRVLERSQDQKNAKQVWNQWQKMLRWPGPIWAGPDVDSVEFFFTTLAGFSVDPQWMAKAYVAREISALDSDLQLPLILD